jgi:glutathione synthase
MRILIVADPIGTLKPRGDTGLALLHEAVLRGYEAFWCTPADLFIEAGRGLALLFPVTSSKAGELPVCGEPRVESLGELDVILIRKDPPFDDAYVSTCWILSSLEGRVLVSNRASLLLTHHEKWIPMLAASAGFLKADDWIPPSLFFSKETFRHWFDTLTQKGLSGRWIVKPWRGYAGHSIFRVENNEDLCSRMSSLTDLEVGWIVQPYHEKVEETGDRRVFVLNGELRGSFIRRAQAGDYVTNMAQGGYVQFGEMSEVERRVCERAAGYLRHCGIDFAGLDIVDSRVNEINVTAPTGIRVLKDETGINLAQEYWDLMEHRQRQM